MRYISRMTRVARRERKPGSAQESLARAPVGPPLTAEERARLEAVRARGLGGGVPHASIMRQLEERKRREQ
jgi:hypothetical protein